MTSDRSVLFILNDLSVPQKQKNAELPFGKSSPWKFSVLSAYFAVYWAAVCAAAPAGAVVETYCALT